MRKEEEKGTIITIEEEVRIPDTDIILEKGDKIRVIEAEKTEEKKEEMGDEDDMDKDEKEPEEEKKKK